ncbi:MAG: fimbria/pilus periplasmic chaperone [Chlamydiota bacterium]
MFRSIPFIFIFFLYFQSEVFCWGVSPSRYTIKEGDKHYYHLDINAANTTTATPIEVTAARRAVDKYGRESWEPIEDRFLIYPSLCVVPPGGSQKVRVFWKGNFKDTREEEAYRIIVQSLPVDLNKDRIDEVREGVKIGLNVLKKYVTSLFVEPKKAQAKLVIKSHSVTELDEGKGIVVNLKNLGNKHITLIDYILVLSSGRHLFEIDRKHISQTNSASTLLPFHEMEWIVPIPADLPKDFDLEACKLTMKVLKSR